MFIKFIHHPRATVHEGVGLIFGVLANSVTRKPTHSMLVNQIGRLYNVYVFVVLEGVRKDSKSQTK